MIITINNPIAHIRLNRLCLNRLRVIVALFSFFLLSSAMTQQLQADQWMFRRSYHSHVIPENMQHNYPRPESRSAYRRPVVHHRPGFAIRGGYRYDTMFLRSGSSTDVTVYRENWFDFRP